MAVARLGSLCSPCLRSPAATALPGPQLRRLPALGKGGKTAVKSELGQIVLLAMVKLLSQAGRALLASR